VERSAISIPAARCAHDQLHLSSFPLLDNWFRIPALVELLHQRGCCAVDQSPNECWQRAALVWTFLSVMDPRHSLSRTHSSNAQQAPYPNMATTYAMPYQPHLPPLHQHQQQQQPPTSQGPYLPPSYRHDLPRTSSSGSGQLASRYPPAPQFSSQGAPSGFPSAPLLPQPSHQMLHLQGYAPTSTTSQGYQPRIAPAPVRNDYSSMSNPPFTQLDNRPQLWSSTETVPNVLADASREPPRTHVVGAQGRRGILPSAPGRAAVPANAANGTFKSNAMPAKDANGKFPCPNCNKTYLHAKHLKRHLLRRGSISSSRIHVAD